MHHFGLCSSLRQSAYDTTPNSPNFLVSCSLCTNLGHIDFQFYTFAIPFEPRVVHSPETSVYRWYILKWPTARTWRNMEVRVVSKQREIWQQLRLEELIGHRLFDRILSLLLPHSSCFSLAVSKAKKKVQVCWSEIRWSLARYWQHTLRPY